MKKLYLAFFLLAAILLQIPTLQAQEIDAVQAHGLLSKNAIRLNLSANDVENSIIVNAYQDNLSKLKLVYVQQAFNGIPVYNVIQVFAFKNDIALSQSGDRIYRIEDRISDQKSIPTISAKEAVGIAAGVLNIPKEILRTTPLSIAKTLPGNRKIVFDKNPVSQEPVTSELMWVPDEKGNVQLAWQVSILPQNVSDFWVIRIDAKSGVVLGKDNLTVHCSWEDPRQKENNFLSVLKHGGNAGKLKFSTAKSNASVSAVNGAQYKVIPFPAESMNHPGGSLTLVNNPWLLSGAGNNAGTLNWHNDGTSEYDYTRGNNVWARDDIAGDNENTIGTPATSTTSLPNLLFNFPFDGAQAPGSTDNKNLALTNLFYWNNITHDLSYQYGFDEVSGNFQNNNLGRGGVQSDYVIADAQDGSGRSNANFGTGPDGSKPRMQMFLFDGNRLEKVSIDIPGIYTGLINTLEGNLSTANQLRNIGPVSGDLVLLNDDLAGTTHLGCGSPANAASLSGKIALIDRGTCNFAVKVKNAQIAGAIAVLVINTVDGELIVMGGSDNTITIPALMMLKGDGDAIKTYLATKTIHATLKAPIDLDGDLDNGVIVHEYTHGISTRLTGGAATATCLLNNEQMGEGWSDYVALMTTTNWSTATLTDGSLPRPLGTYVLDEDPSTGLGIRNYPYSTDMGVNPWTYGQLSSIEESEEHAVGEIWAATLWDMTWNMIQIDGINTNIFNANGTGGNTDALKLVMLGMKLQPCSPGFLDGRDAILKADELLFNGKYNCAIWNAFARRGMGVNAKQGTAYNTFDQTQNFDVPSGASITKKVDQVVSPQNGLLTYTFTVKAQCQPVTNFKVVDTLPANVTYVSGGTYNAGDGTVTFNVPNLSSLQSTSFTLKVKVKEGTFFNDVELFSEQIPANAVPSTLAATTNQPGTNWSGNSTSKSAPFSLRSAATSLPAEQVLTSVSPVTIDGHVQLSFWQLYSTEPGKDGGVVELSMDGSNWFDAGPYMIVNGYNTTINSNSSLDSRRAFSGSNSSFMQTVINLSAFKNQSVYYRFRYVTDTAGFSIGWYIDDILIRKMAAVYNIAKVFDGGNVVKSLSDTITAISNAVIPVTWTDFSVQKNGDVALLKWATSQESNTDKFFVERSTDGIHFNTIAVVQAAGNSGNPIHYSYDDAHPQPGINYYRIRLSDLDGKISYSPTKAVEFDLKAKYVQLSPNPAKDHVSLSIPGNKDLLKVKVVDATGRVIRNYEMDSDQLKIPVDHFASGIYYINIKGKNLNVMKKLVKD